MDIVESNNLLILSKDNRATPDHIMEKACIAIGKEFHCICLGPVSPLDNTDLLLTSLAIASSKILMQNHVGPLFCRSQMLILWII